MIDWFASLTNTNGLPFPGTLTTNATGAGTGDGTELVKVLMDQFVGAFNAILDEAGLTPDSVTEAPGTSQVVDAIRKISGSPGEGVLWWKNSDPATTGDRVLLLSGQVILIADYTPLVDATYKGDGNNATASAFYKTSDAGGTTRSTSGTYFVLPDLRGYFVRGLDVAASIDPDGATRDVGSTQLDAFQGFNMDLRNIGSGNSWTDSDSTDTGSGLTVVTRVASKQSNSYEAVGFITDGVNGTPRVDSETRAINVATKFGIRY